MAIVTNAATCLRWLAHDQFNLDEARRAAERIVQDGHRAGDVIASIRSLARKSAPVRRKMDLHEAIIEVFALLRYELRRHNVVHEIELATEAGLVLGDRVQLQQAILNLIMNGVEAMKDTPAPLRRLRVSTRAEDSSYTLVTVADAGSGVDAMSIKNIFDAFFTTKPQGLGIGLSICRSIIEAHGGRLWASSNYPRGSIFCFTLPTVRQADLDGPLQ
jgi:signal transduction histidine kinase